MTSPIPAALNSDEVREILTDRKRLSALLNDPDTFVEWTENSINARLKDRDVTDNVKEQTEMFMANWLRENGMEGSTAKRLNLDNANARSRIRPQTVYNRKAPGAKYDDYFGNTTDFLYSISAHAHRDESLSRKLGTLKNDLSSVKPSDGGFLIPEILRAELLRTSLENAIVRSRARIIPMDSLTVPFPTVDATSNVSSVFGGVVGYWSEEGATLTESQPRFGRVELKAQKLTLYTEVPNELIRDAQPSLEAFISGIFPEAIAWFEDVAFFVGSGVGEPLGFLNAPARIQVTRDSGSPSIEWIDVVNMYCRMLPQSLSRAVWIVSPDALPNLFTMTFDTGSGSGTSPVMMGGPGFGNGGTQAPPMTMLGLPIIVSEKARALGTAGDLNLVDFGFYLIGDRQAMSARQSEEFRFQNDITAFRVTERLDGRPWLASAISPQNGSSSTLSPFVQLD